MELKQQVQILTSTIYTFANRKTMNKFFKLHDEIKLPIKTFAGMDKLEELLQAASTKQAVVQHLFYFFYWVFIVVNSYPGIKVMHTRLQFLTLTFYCFLK